jgi:hypothetical protein
MPLWSSLCGRAFVASQVAPWERLDDQEAILMNEVLQQRGLEVALCLLIPQDKSCVKNFLSLIPLYGSAFLICNPCLPLLS